MRLVPLPPLMLLQRLHVTQLSFFMFPCKVGLVNDTNIKQLFQGIQRLDKVLSPMPSSKYAISQCLPLSLLFQTTRVNFAKAEIHYLSELRVFVAQ